MTKIENLKSSQEEIENIHIEEANAIVNLLKALKLCGIDLAENVAIITQFRKQMELIENLCCQIHKCIQVHTIDRFQVLFYSNFIFVI